MELPVVLLNAKADAVPLGAADAVCLALWLAGFLLEAAADNQKFVFRSKPENRNRYITSGVPGARLRLSTPLKSLRAIHPHP